MVEALAATTEKVKVMSADGRVLGTFAPGKFLPPPGMVSDISVEESRRRAADPTTKWYTLSEIMAKLRAL